MLQAERFQVVTVQPAGILSIDRSHLGVGRSADAIIVQVFLNTGRDAATLLRGLVVNFAGANLEDRWFG